MLTKCVPLKSPCYEKCAYKDFESIKIMLVNHCKETLFSITNQSSNAEVTVWCTIFQSVPKCFHVLCSGKRSGNVGWK